MNKKIQNQIFNVKIIFILFLIFVCNVSFANINTTSPTQNDVWQVINQKKITLDLKNRSLEYILTEVQKNTGIGFVIKEDSKSVALNGLSLTVKDVTVKEALDVLLSNTNYNYQIVNNIITISRKADAKTAAQAKRAIEGIVSDFSTKASIPGATVLILGTSVGAITDINGRFSMQVSNNQKLEISCVGMKPEIITITADMKTLNIKLKVDEMIVDDVIITGYQTISKERATGSFATISPTKLEAKLQPNLSSILEGQVAGLVRDKDGNISIRGISTINATSSPLIILDGFPYDGGLSSINSDNIENITVLKDGVAASIYGSRAANGVIVVTSKTGKPGSFNVSYKGVLSATLKSNFKDFNRGSSSDFIDGEMAIFFEGPYGSNTSYETPVVRHLVDAYNAGNNEAAYAKAYKEIDKYRNIDGYEEVQKYIHRSKTSHSHNIGINGGTDKNQFNASIKYVDETGSMINDSNNRFTFDLKNSWKPKEWLKFDVAANINYTSSDNTQVSWLGLVGAFGLAPYERIVDDNGKSIDIGPRLSPYLKNIYDNTEGSLPYTYNIIDNMAETKEYNSSYNTRLSANVNAKITDGLTVTASGLWARGNSNWRRVDTKDSYRVRNMVNGATDKKNSIVKYLPYGDIVEEDRNISESWTLRGQINFNKGYNKDKHRVTALLGTEIRKDGYRNNRYATRVGSNKEAGTFGFMNIKDWNAGKDGVNMISKPSFTMSNGLLTLRDNRFVSYYGNASYEFNNRYIISGSARLDLTNFFGTDPKYRYKPLWSLGGTWKLSKEKFFNIDVIDMLNIRASYGINGNISLSQGPFLILSVGTSHSDLTGGTPYGVSSPVNNQLRWEKTATTNFGTDFSVMNGRFNISIDYYNKLSTDLLASDANDAITGYASLTRNVGSMSNKGIEISLDANIIKKGHFRWNAKINYAYNKNKILKYNVSRPLATWWTTVMGVYSEGYPVGALFASRFAGLDNRGTTQIYSPDDNVKYLGGILPEDLVYMGTSKAPHDLSFSSDLHYKNFNLSFMLVAKLGSKYRRDAFSGSNFQNRHFKERWQKPGDEETTMYPKFGRWNMDMFDYPYIDKLIQSSSYMKLRDLTLTYSLPKPVLNKIGFSDVRIYVQTRNLFRVTGKNVDIDPETLSAASGTGGMSDASITSLSRRPEFYVGLSFTF